MLFFSSGITTRFHVPLINHVYTVGLGGEQLLFGLLVVMLNEAKCPRGWTEIAGNWRSWLKSWVEQPLNFIVATRNVLDWHDRIDCFTDRYGPQLYTAASPAETKNKDVKWNWLQVAQQSLTNPRCITANDKILKQSRDHNHAHWGDDNVVLLVN